MGQPPLFAWHGDDGQVRPIEDHFRNADCKTWPVAIMPPTGSAPRTDFRAAVAIQPLADASQPFMPVQPARLAPRRPRRGK